MKIEKTARTTIVGILWTIAIALGITGTIWHVAPMRFWSLTISLIACLLTGQLIIDCALTRERLKLEAAIENLTDGVIDRACERAGVSRLH